MNVPELIDKKQTRKFFNHIWSKYACAKITFTFNIMRKGGRITYRKKKKYLYSEQTRLIVNRTSFITYNLLMDGNIAERVALTNRSGLENSFGTVY